WSSPAWRATNPAPITPAAVQPNVARYLSALQAALKQAGVAVEPMVTKSNGGVMTAELGKSACLQMLLSGTAAGVIGAGFVARQAGLD
ncbi:MAG: hydantoinase/oxoprolinase family protein, partial [Reyranella sp.]